MVLEHPIKHSSEGFRLVSIPVRDLVVLERSTGPEGRWQMEVSIPVRDLVVLEPKGTRSAFNRLQVSIPVRDLVVLERLR